MAATPSAHAPDKAINCYCLVPGANSYDSMPLLVPLSNDQYRLQVVNLNCRELASATTYVGQHPLHTMRGPLRACRTAPESQSQSAEAGASDSKKRKAPDSNPPHEAPRALPLGQGDRLVPPIFQVGGNQPGGIGLALQHSSFVALRRSDAVSGFVPTCPCQDPPASQLAALADWFRLLAFCVGRLLCGYSRPGIAVTVERWIGLLLGQPACVLLVDSHRSGPLSCP